MRNPNAGEKLDARRLFAGIDPAALMGDSRKVLVLLSGGVDSAACVSFYRQRNTPVSALFVDYGQIAASKERSAAIEIARYFRIELAQIRCEGMTEKLDGYVPGRNAFLVFLALTQARFESGLISMGLHQGTDYWDCSERFAHLCQELLHGYSAGRIRVNFPFLNWNKRQVWEFCRDMKVPLNATYSCELGEGQPCGRCGSCADLEVLRAL
jgi:7-cyano-7-deazaguanine synthase